MMPRRRRTDRYFQLNLLRFGVRRSSRMATVGLALSLTLMATFTLLGLHSSTTESVNAKDELALNRAYADVETAVLAAKHAQRDHLEADSAAGRTASAAAYREAGERLHAATSQLRSLGGNQDRALASYIGIEQRRFDETTRQLFADVALGNYDAARALERTTARSALDSLESLVSAAAMVHRDRASDVMRRLTDSNRHSIKTVGALFGVGLAFLAGSWALLLLLQKELQRAAQEQKHRADHDGLTGLPNRALFHLRAKAAVEQSAIEGTRASLLLLDLNDFKPVNDQFGHHAGDVLLTQVGIRLIAELRGHDTAARLGGDEFGVVLPDANPEDVASILVRLCDVLAEPYDIDGQTVIISTSVGAATWPEGGRTVDDLLHAADTAMYLAKQTRCGWRIAEQAAPLTDGVPA